MVVAALVQTYFPSKRQIGSGRKKMRAMSVLASVASDFDLIADWLFNIDVYQNDQVPKKIAYALLTFCIISIFTWLMLASGKR